jgi:hypothetical protein
MMHNQKTIRNAHHTNFPARIAAGKTMKKETNIHTMASVMAANLVE